MQNLTAAYVRAIKHSVHAKAVEGADRVTVSTGLMGTGAFNWPPGQAILALTNAVKEVASYMGSTAAGRSLVLKVVVNDTRHGLIGDRGHLLDQVRACHCL